MRRDFWSLPYAARTAIQRGERAAHEAELRAYTIAELHSRIKELEAELEAIRNGDERVGGIPETPNCNLARRTGGQ